MTDRLRQISLDLRRGIERDPELNRRLVLLNNKGFITTAILSDFMSLPTKDIIPAHLAIRTIFAADPNDVMSGDEAKEEVLNLISPIEGAVISKIRKIATPKEKRKYNL